MRQVPANALERFADVGEHSLFHQLSVDPIIQRRRVGKINIDKAFADRLRR